MLVLTGIIDNIINNLINISYSLTNIGVLVDSNGSNSSTGAITLNYSNNNLELIFSILLGFTGIIAIPFILVIIIFSIHNRKQEKLIKELDSKIMNKEL